MPQLPNYDPGNLGLRPTETGIEARAAVGRRAGAFYREAAGAMDRGAEAQARGAADIARSVGDVVNATETFAKQQEDFAGHREVSAGAAAGAKLFSDLTDQWHAMSAKADPNDPSVATNFRDNVLKPALENFQQAYSNTDRGQAWAEAHVEAMRNQFYRTTAADMSSLAADAVRTNVTRLGNSLSNSARTSPDSVDYLLKNADSSVDAIVSSSPNIKGAASSRIRMEVSEKIKEDIVKSAALGAMEKSANPEAVADAFAKKYPDYIKGDEIGQFARMARYYKNIANSESRAARVQNDYLAKNDFNTKINKLESDTMPQNAGDPPQLPQDYWQRLRELSTHPGAALEPGRLASMATKGEAITARLNKPEPLGRISHDTTMGLLGDIRAGRMTDNGAIYDAYGQGKLNRADFAFLNNEFAQLRTPQGAALSRDRTEFFKRWAPIIDGGMNTAGIHSLLGTQQAYAFEMDARRQEEVLRKAGKDPHGVYDPRSPDFFGRPENIVKYRVTLQQAQDYEKTLTAMDKNITGPGKTVAGQEVINQPPGAKTFVPPANWQFSPSRNQYRDPSGKLYDVSGKPI